MNTYLIPINEGSGPYIKKISANNAKIAEEKLFKYFFDKYEFLEGDNLKEIKDQLWDSGIDVGQIYDIDELM